MPEAIVENKMLDLTEKNRMTLSSFFFELEDAARAGIINFSSFNEATGIDNKMRALDPYFRYFDIYPRMFSSMFTMIGNDLKSGEKARELGIDPETMSIRDFIRYLESILGFIDEDDTGEVEEH